ncbi:MAG: NAD-dependent epimerase/dehydratase family protein [Candidatus Omnitrophica bacterium]|nr:NAD-dependent epimerase/dehydratase family protein [Candidatus Omnitrophota bacterium]
MGVCLVTGSCGLVGSESAFYFAKSGLKIVGIDNDMRAKYFGKTASTRKMKKLLSERISGYEHHALDIRQLTGLEKVFEKYAKDIKLIIHSAAQPSHDWATDYPLVDFNVNATATLQLLELTRKYCPRAIFIFSSSNKVYGDTPNHLPLRELPLRWEIEENHSFYHGIDESMSVDSSKHSIFGVSKLAADIMVQEYGRYFGMRTGVFRAGCLTGPNHAGTELHGFLSYLVKCAANQQKYTIFGYKGKQVRDNIHSYDLVTAFDYFYKNPRTGEAYNIGGGRQNSCSILEAIGMCEKLSGRTLEDQYGQARSADHIWYISNVRKFQSQYPQWHQTYSLNRILEEMFHSY